MEFLYVTLGITVVLLLLAGALRWTVRVADRNAHRARDGHFNESGKGCDPSSGDGD